jgi:hypothetical protein
MSAELVGYENLPNVFIKEVSIFDYNEAELKIKVTCRLFDVKQAHIWYDTSELIAKMMKVGMIFSTDMETSQGLNLGTVSPVSLKYVSRKISYPMEHEDNYVFDVFFEKMMPKQIQHLNLYAFCFIDDRDMREDTGMSHGGEYYGPIKSEKIFSDFKLVNETNVFIKQDGEYWPGPVHVNNNKFMAGSFHTDQSHFSLVRLRIPNSKIKDFREHKQTSRESELMKEGQVSSLMVSYNSKTDINALFMINVKSILKNNTRFGAFLNKATNTAIDELVTNFKINLLTVQRIRLRKNRGNITTSAFTKKNIIKSYDLNNNLRNMTRFEKKISYDLVVPELRSNTNNVDRREKEIFVEELSDYKRISSIKELYFEYGREIRAFQFNDYELTDKTPGKYQYKVEMHFSDPTYKFLLDIVSAMKLAISDIKMYISSVSRGNITMQPAEVQSLVDTYIRYYSYIYTTTMSEKTNLSIQMFSLIDPSTVSLQSSKKCLEKFSKLYFEFLHFLDFDRFSYSEARKVSVLAKNNMINRILITKQFDTIIEPSSNQVGFGYIENTTTDEMKTLSKIQFQQRVENENKELYKETTRTDSPDRDTKTNQGLNDIYSKRTAYIGATSVKTGMQRYDLKSNTSRTQEMLNKIMPGNSSQQGIMVQDTSVPAENKEEESNSAFIESSKIIGNNQGFVSYEKVTDSYNVARSQNAGRKKLDDYFSGYQNNRTFSAVLAKTKDLSPMEAENLPNQLKAVIHGESEATKQEYVTSGVDLLANPKTKNYYEMNNFSVQRVIYIDGFKKDSSENILLNVPIYKEMLFSNFSNLSKPVVCFLETYVNDKFDISGENKAQVIDSFFIISDTDMSISTFLETSDNLPIYNIQESSFEFMNSNIITQSNTASFANQSIATITLGFNQSTSTGQDPSSAGYANQNTSTTAGT